MELPERTIDVLPADALETYFEGLYERAFPAFARFAVRMRASFDDAKDIFHDALVIYCEKSREAGFRVITSPEAYVVGIAKHLWARKFNRGRREIALTLEESLITIPEDYFPSVNESRLLRFVERAGRKCMDLLLSFYYKKATLTEIADLHGYRTEHSAAVQKYKCLAKVRDAIKAKSMDYEDFYS